MIPLKKPISIPFILALLLLVAHISLAQTHKEFTPSLSIIEEYDDNIYLANNNEISSYMTMVSPGFLFSLLSQQTQLELEYAPTFVWYSEESVDSEVRHAGTLTFGRDLTEHFRFDLTNTYIRSDDPLEETETVVGARETRNTYERNSGSASLTYLFGPENSLELGYRDERLSNEEESEDNGTTHNPYAALAYRINIKHRLEFEYGYMTAHFWRDDGLAAEDDFYGHEPTIRYVYSFTPHTEGSVTYSFTTRNFDASEEDYKVHEGLIGFEHAFSPSYSVAAGIGYFIQDRSYSSDEDGYVYNLLLTKAFERGSIEIGGEGGWSQDVLDPDDTGFTRYWSGTASIDYQVLEPLTTYATGAFRHDKEDDGREYDTMRGNCGLTWTFLRWFSLTLDYTYAERDDDITLESYKDNRLSLIFTAGRLYRW